MTTLENMNCSLFANVALAFTIYPLPACNVFACAKYKVRPDSSSPLVYLNSYTRADIFNELSIAVLTLNGRHSVDHLLCVN